MHLTDAQTEALMSTAESRLENYSGLSPAAAEKLAKSKVRLAIATAAGDPRDIAMASANLAIEKIIAANEILAAMMRGR